MKIFYDTIEDVMMRLEEFQSIIEMVRDKKRKPMINFQQK